MRDARRVVAGERNWSDGKAEGRGVAVTPNQVDEGSVRSTELGSSEVPPELMLAEAYRIIDAARAQGLDLRLTGGLAVRHLCTDKDFLRRFHSDIDMVGRRAQSDELWHIFRSCGYMEAVHVLAGTGGLQRQFYAVPASSARSPDLSGSRGSTRSPGATVAAPHVDVYLDVMRVDHDVWIGNRIDIDDYTIAPADLLISKLQAGRFEEKDLRDVVALLKDLPFGDADAGHEINVGHSADVCSRDWGLYLDVATNIDAVEEEVLGFGLADAVGEGVIAALDTIADAIANEEKTFRWRLRARLGKRVPWRREMEETDGAALVTAAEAELQAGTVADDAEWTGWPGWGGGPSSHHPRH